MRRVTSISGGRSCDREDDEQRIQNSIVVGRVAFNIRWVLLRLISGSY